VGHRVDVVGEVLRGAGDPRHHGLAAELALGTDLARHTTDFAGKRIKLVDHGVDRILQLQDLAFHVDRDFAVEFAACHGGGDLGDVTHLRGEVAAHGVDGVCQVFPRSRHAGHGRLHTKTALGAYLTRHARDLRT